MPRKQKKYHYIYKTTNILNDKFYIGMHSTDNLDDGYLGSGKRLWYSINKHGKENHKREILEFLPNRNLLKEREAEMVNEDLLQEPQCMNLIVGGYGNVNGWEAVNRDKRNIYEGHAEQAKKNLQNATPKFLFLMENDEFRKTFSSKISISLKNRWNEYGHNWVGKNHTEKTKQKMVETHKLNNHQKGEKNSQYGTCWIYSLKENRSIKIKKRELNEYIDNGWIVGRKKFN